MEAINILKKSIEALQGRALQADKELEHLEQLSQDKTNEIKDCFNRIKELEIAIKILEAQDESTSQN